MSILSSLMWLAAALAFLGLAVGIGVREIVRHVRHRRALARLNSTMKGADDLMDYFAKRFIARNVRVTRYADRRYRDGPLSW